MKVRIRKLIPKFIQKFLIILIISIIWHQTAAFALFSDINESNKNYEAINYLQENGILNGYLDGSFKPDNSVNRAEFLKIIIEGSNIETNVAENTPFKDVNHLTWYAPYIKKAYSEDWINGYADGSFKPEQTINKAEALKILGKAQNWQLPSLVSSKPFNDIPINEWYSPYIDYAKNKGLLEEKPLFFPAMLMSRASISEIIYRSIIAASDTNEEKPNIVLIPAEEENQPAEANTETTESGAETSENIPSDSSSAEDANIEFKEFKTISKSLYDNIILTEDLPNNFYKNEIYIIKGNATSGNYSTATAIFEGISDSTYQTFSGEINNNDNFEISVYFPKTGNYNFGILAGDSGTTKAVEISVLPYIPNSQNTESTPSPANSINVSYENDQTSINFSAANSTLKILEFTQNLKNIRYISRQNISFFPLKYSDFTDFSEGKVDYSIKLAKISSAKPLEIASEFVTSSTKNFNAVEHSFDSIIEEEITANPIDTLPFARQFSFTGTAKKDISKNAYVIKPDGFVDELELTTMGSTGTYFTNPIIESGNNFTFTYTPSANGRYIVEINNKFGEPVINHPIYAGDIIPLIPDFFDINEREFFEGAVTINSFRQDLLNLINKARSDHGLNPIELSEELNNLAQAHSDDMAQNNFFAHVNPRNQTPEDRRIAAGIKTAISENIAKDVSLEFGHYGLMRSASHRENILNPLWTRAGLGITENDGYLFITEEFSIDELTQTDLNQYKSELYSEINILRNNLGKTALILNNELDLICEELNNRAIDDNITLTNELFTQYLTDYEISGISQAIGRTHNIWPDILSSILSEEESNLIESAWELVGINLQTDNTGLIHAILILNDPS